MYPANHPVWRSSPATELRVLVRLALPVVLTQLGLIAMGTVDVMMVGQLGERALAGVSIGHLWSFGTLAVLLGCASGLDPAFSQAYGSKQPHTAGRVLVQGGVFLVLVAVPVIALHLLAAPVLSALGQPQAAIPIGAAYCRVMALGVLPFTVFVLLQRFLQGSGHMILVTFAIVVGNIVNVIASWALVFGRLGFASYGAVGAAWATVVCNTAMIMPLIWWGWPLIVEAKPKWSHAFQLRAIASLWTICLPVGFQVLAEVWGFHSVGFLMGWLGETAVSSHMVALGFTAIAFMVPLGVSQAAATRIGNLIGASRPWGLAAWLSISMGAIAMVGFGVAMVTVPEWLARWYTVDPKVIALSVQLLPIAAAFGFVDGVQAVTFGVLRGAGDLRVPAMANVVGYYLVGLPLGGYLAFRANWGPVGLWIGLAVALTVIAALLLVRLRITMRRGGYLVVADGATPRARHAGPPPG